MGELVTTLVGGAVILFGTGAAIYFYQRSLDKPGGREGLGATGDMFGVLTEIDVPNLRVLRSVPVGPQPWGVVVRP